MFSFASQIRWLDGHTHGRLGRLDHSWPPRNRTAKPLSTELRWAILYILNHVPFACRKPRTQYSTSLWTQQLRMLGPALRVLCSQARQVLEYFARLLVKLRTLEPGLTLLAVLVSTGTHAWGLMLAHSLVTGFSWITRP